MIRGVIFDYGSTLIHFDGDMKEVRVRAHKALAECLRREGVELREASFLDRLARKFDEYERRRGIDHMETTAASVLAATIRDEGLPAQPEEKIRRALRSMFKVFEPRWKLFPETRGALRKVSRLGLRMAMLSNASDENNVRQMIRNHRLGKIFDPVVISAAIGIRKPDPRAFRPILKAWGFPPQDIVMVGDRLEMDILGAKALGMRAIWICGDDQAAFEQARRKNFLPDAQVKTIGEVAAILAYWKEKSRR
jgi:HAD superfamily hydrolase (TIGR01493 family)